MDAENHVPQLKCKPLVLASVDAVKTVLLHALKDAQNHVPPLKCKLLVPASVDAERTVLLHALKDAQNHVPPHQKCKSEHHALQAVELDPDKQLVKKDAQDEQFTRGL